MIETRGLSKVFHDKKRGAIRAVDNVSFACRPGQIYGLLGANGAGKTTTLRILATILEPTEGTAVVCGHDVIDEPDKVRANVGFHDPQVMIFDEPTLGLDVMTARTIIDFIRDCRQRGKTVMFSTHVMNEVEKLCDVVGIIQSGKLLDEGSLAELRDRYHETDLEEIFVKVVAPLYVSEEAH